jgi:hypothetical protein
MNIIRRMNIRKFSSVIPSTRFIKKRTQYRPIPPPKYEFDGLPENEPDYKPYQRSEKIEPIKKEKNINIHLYFWHIGG